APRPYWPPRPPSTSTSRSTCSRAAVRRTPPYRSSSRDPASGHAGRITLRVILASIPSPSSGSVHLGPFTIHMYGRMLLLGIAAPVALRGIRWTRRGGDWDLVFQAAVWGVAAGVVGARIYHDITSWNEVPHTWWGPFAVWEGGLGIWGGIAC